MQAPATSLAEPNSELFVLDMTRALPAQVDDLTWSANIKKVSTTMGDSPAHSKASWKTVGDWRLIGCCNPSKLVSLTKSTSGYLIWMDRWILARARYRATPSFLPTTARSHATWMIRT